jgi:uncharacterized protein (DUF1330 family)
LGELPDQTNSKGCVRVLLEEAAMAAYVIALIDVRDKENYPQYTRLVSATLKPYGGTVLARGGKTEVLEGSARSRVVMIQFDTFESARRWYHSEAYTSARALRQAMAWSDVFIVEGVEVETSVDHR